MSYNVERLAVLLCGDLRTWDQACESIFKYSESIGKTVDYYFATWNSTRDLWIHPSLRDQTKRYISEQEITSKFSERNLVSVRIFDLDKVDQYAVTYYYQSFLSKIANIEKRKYELANNFVYDQVIELRPDLGVDFDAKENGIGIKNIRDCKNFEYKISHVHYGCDLRIPHLTDFYFRSDSFTNDVLSNRYWFSKDTMKYSQAHSGLNVNNHWLLSSYVMHRRLLDNELFSDPGILYTIEEHGIWPIRPNTVTDRK